MMGKGLHVFVFFMLSLFILQLQAQDNPPHQFKLMGGNLSVTGFHLQDGDTIYEKYEKKRLVVEEQDSIIYAEFFNDKKHWFLYRYKLVNGKPYLFGWQKEFDLENYLLYERYCTLGERQSYVTKKYNYYPNGQISSVLSYFKNRLDGQSLYYYSNGQLRQNIEYQNGHVMDVVAYYDQEGNVMDIGDFCEGYGTMQIYSMNGKLIQLRIFENGKMKKKIKVAREEN